MASPVFDTFSVSLQAQLVALNVSQAELARRMNISAQAVSRWMSTPSVVPRASTVLQVAHALGVDASVLDPRLPVATSRIRGDALAGVPGLHVAYLATAIRALGRAREAICKLSPSEALESAYGKQDSLRVDVVAEHSIVATLEAFDSRACLLSEERGLVFPENGHPETLLWCTDPVDRSRALRDQLRNTRVATLGELFVSESFPMRGVDAPVGAISAVAHGEVLFSCLLDYGTGMLYVAFPDLVVSCPIFKARTPDELAMNGQPLAFSDDGSAEDVSTFVGDKNDPRHAGRVHTFLGLGFRKDQIPNTASGYPGGPARILRMCDDLAISRGEPAGMVVATGERLGEWVHWLPFCTNSRVLSIYELWCGDFLDDVLVAPPPGYSILQGVGQLGVQTDVRRLMALPRPHHYRGAIAIARTGSMEDVFLRALPHHRRIHGRG